MRLTKMLGLAAVAAMATMAFAGATTASADTICTVKTADSGECPAANRLALPQTIKGATAAGAPATLLSNLVNVECESSVTAEAKTNDGPHTQLLGLITALTFTGCKGCTKATAEHLPYLFEALALALLLHVKSDGGGNPSALLEGCPFATHCLYETASALLKIDLPGENGVGSPLEFLAEKVPLTKNAGGSSGLCPANAEWDAHYVISSPNAGQLWLTALP